MFKQVVRRKLETTERTLPLATCQIPTDNSLVS